MAFGLDTRDRREVAIVAAAMLINVAVLFWGEARGITLLGLVNGLVPVVIRWLREWRSEVKSIEVFGWGWGATVTYGALLIFVSLQLASMIGGIIAGAVIGATGGPPLGDNPELTNLTSNLSILLLGIPLVYLAGRVMGRRSTADGPVYRGVIAVSIAAAIAVLVSVAFTWALGATVFLTAMFEQLGSVGGVAIALAVFCVLVVLVPALAGYHRGRRQRIGAYMAYVLNKVNVETRQTIVALAYQEAARTDGRGGQGNS